MSAESPASKTLTCFETWPLAEKRNPSGPGYGMFLQPMGTLSRLRVVDKIPPELRRPVSVEAATIQVKLPKSLETFRRRLRCIGIPFRIVSSSLQEHPRLPTCWNPHQPHMSLASRTLGLVARSPRLQIETCSLH